MRVTFMSKHTPLLELEYANGVFEKITDIYCKDKLPFALINDPSIESFNRFMKLRLIPENRENLDVTKDKFGQSWVRPHSYCALHDQYFVRYESETWEDVNFYHNPMSKDIGDASFLPWTIEKISDNNSPDLVTGGVIQKRWVIIDNQYYLLKAKSNAYRQEPLNEVLSSLLLEKLNLLPFVKYELYIEGVSLVSKCKNFVDEDHELVTAAQLLEYKAKPHGISIKEHLNSLCEELGVPNCMGYIEKMNFVDMYLGNKDRHLNNIAFMRNVETGKLDGFAPLYDFGQIMTAKTTIDFSKYQHLIDDFNIAERLLNKNEYLPLIETYPYVSDRRKQKILVHLNNVGADIRRRSSQEPEMDF